VIACIAFIGAIATVPVYAQGGDDSVSSLAQELNQEQREKMREAFMQFAQKQEQVPTPGEVVLDNRPMLKDIITSPDFDKQKAQAFVEKVTAAIQEATVNRLQLRHDLYHQLDAKQQKQYLEMVQSMAAELLQ
jgi:Spy/CpxP family protein refolding chaperone